MKRQAATAATAAATAATKASDENVRHDPRWARVLARDASGDGTFVFAVRTTGVYCRPSCGARRPLPANVVFFATPAAARAGGFRACKRCRPDVAAHGVAPDAALRAAVVQQVCRWLDEADAPPRLADLAARAGYSPFHLQRVFRAAVGLSPRGWFAARRRERLRDELARGRSVTVAAHRAGFGSSSRLHATAERALGMLPSRAKAGGAGERIEYALVPCSLGTALVAATARGVCAILLGDRRVPLEVDLRRRFPRADLRPGDRAFGERIASVIACVDGERADPGLPLDVRGTAFQQRVWDALRSIPAGSTQDYTELARSLGSPRGARAVAKACADNPLAVVVPCHRVVRRDGDLAGYRWGLERKHALLEREGAAPTPAPAPAAKR